MAASKKAAKKATKKTAKKGSKKVSRKVAKKVTKKATAKKAVRKVARKSSRKPARKAAKKVSRKTTKKATKKSTASRQRKSSAGSRKPALEERLDHLQELLPSNLSGINSDKAEALAKEIWLAGLGAYSRTFNELAGRVDKIQDRYESINAEGQKVFDELVERGESMQGDFEKAVKHGRETLDKRVEEFKKRFGGGLSAYVDIPARLRDAAEKIEELSEKLQKK